MEALFKVTHVINSSLHLEEMVETVIDQAMLVLNAEAGTLWLVDVDDGDIVPLVARGPRADGLKGLRLKPGEGIAGQVILHREPFLVEDVRSDPKWAGRFDQQTGFITRSILCVPLVARDKCVGCLQLLNRKKGLFDPRDLELAVAFAGQAALAVDNSQLFTNQQRLLLSLLQTLSSALDARDPYTHGHSERVSSYSMVIARALGMTREGLEEVQRVSLLHDIGKIGIRDHILLAAGPLDQEAWETMKTHTEIGAQIIKQMQPRFLVGSITDGALCHQERYDGKGYPRGLKGEEIPLIGRIIAVADTYDAMTTDRPYRKGFSSEVALAEIRKSAGTQLDPHLAEVFAREMEAQLT